MFNPPKLIGHRGVKNLSPENTLNSIQKAFELGLKWIEVDVKISKDSIPILLHDDTFDRTTNGNGFPYNFKYDEIKKLDAGKYFYNYSTDIIVPTLEKSLLFCQKNFLNINIELKPNTGLENKNVKAIAKLMKDINFTRDYYFSSFNFFSLINIKKILNTAKCGIIIDNFNKENSLENILNICKKYNFFSCCLDEKIVNQEIILNLKKNNLITAVYSNKNIEPKDAKYLWNIGVDTIFIDDPRNFDI